MASQLSVCKTVLPNGIRILSENVPYVDSISIGIWAHTGSIDEVESHRGISHFIEHMMFKGTQSRSARQIADQMDYLGGHLNAFTDKEFTCYYVKVLTEHIDTALNVLSDMMLNSVFDPVEIDREKNVVLEEVKQHQDSPEDYVHDVLAQILWRGHRLGNSVIGLEEVIQNLDQEKLLGHLHEFYRPDALLISAAGKVDHARLVDAVSSAFGGMTGKRPVRVPQPVIIQSEKKRINKVTEQVHFCLGTDGFNQDSEQKFALATIDAVLGGGMSSRLFQEIRESRGLAYSIGSYSAAYKEAGMFSVYGGTSMENIDQVLDIIEKECESIGANSVTDVELERAKNQIRGALVLGQESMSNRMSRLAKSELYFGRMMRLDEIVHSMMQVNKDDVAKVASELFEDSKFSFAAIGPFEK